MKNKIYIRMTKRDEQRKEDLEKIKKEINIFLQQTPYFLIYIFSIYVINVE